MEKIVLLLLSLIAVSAIAEKQPFERYQTIVDRQMFGPLPPGFDPTKPPSEVSKSSVSDKELSVEQEKLQSAVHFSVIDVRPDGEVVVGFTDHSDPKVPRNYFLRVGESRDGWEVRSADPDAATMTIAKDEIEVTLTLGGDSSKDGNATSRAGDAQRPAGGGRSRLSGNLLGGGMSNVSSLRARRLQRQQQAAAEQARQAEESAAREAERQAQVEQDKQQREQERAEYRRQMQELQEEMLKRVREERAKSSGGDSDAQDDAE